MSYVPLIGAFWMHFVHGPYLLLFGLIGAVPASVCAWLSTERRGQAAST